MSSVSSFSTINPAPDKVTFEVRDYQDKDWEKAWEIIQEGWRDSVFLQIEEEILLDNCRLFSFPPLMDDSYKKLVLIQKDQELEPLEQIIGYLSLEQTGAKAYHICDFYIKKE